MATVDLTVPMYDDVEYPAEDPTCEVCGIPAVEEVDGVGLCAWCLEMERAGWPDKDNVSEEETR